MDKVTIDMNKLSDKDRELVKSIVAKVENPFDIPTEEPSYYYYYINSLGNICGEAWDCSTTDKSRYLSGNYFLTRKDAEFEVEKRRIIRKLEILAKKAGRANWNNPNTIKHYIEYNTVKGCIYLNCLYTHKTQGAIYFPTEESLQDAIDLIGENNIKKYLFGVEE